VVSKLLLKAGSGKDSHMQQFALASVYPRSIAWLIRPGEWDRFEKIVKYNCAMVGGYFNVIVPLTEQDTISEEYQRFLADYDADLIVLAPGMAAEQLDQLSNRLHPFGIVPWESVSGIASLDPLSIRGGMNATTVSEWEKILTGKRPVDTHIAIADECYPDTSRLALVACGDVDLDATDYRKTFLELSLAPGLGRKYAGAFRQEDETLAPVPDRYHLKNIISEESQFPLTGAAKILKTCCRLQHFPSIHQSFIGSTVAYLKSGGTPQRTKSNGHPPAMIVLVSDQFSLEEATMFWNLRANAVYVAWLSFSQLENEGDDIVKWLDSDYGGVFYSMWGGATAFSSMNRDIVRLQTIIGNLQEKRSQSYLEWKIIPHEDLIFYNYARPYILQERVIVMKDGAKYTFIPRRPDESHIGIYTVTLEWNGCMLPQQEKIIQNEISSEMVEGFKLAWEGIRGSLIKSTVMPRFRITNDRYLKAQIDSERPIEFSRPSPEQVIEILFANAGFPRVERSSTARYHTTFIHRADGLDNTAYYLAHSPYRKLFDVLSDHTIKSKSGWILKNPSDRRALHHLHLREVLGKMILSETQKYFDTVSDELPSEAFSLLQKGWLERGFHLKCQACSFHSWYPAQHVGQTFECTRCFQAQVYDSNPLWLYKLPEVIFQGFEDNMQVPILALSYLKRMGKHYFEWVPDSNVYLPPEGKVPYKNIDILCICDGKFYVGEAKSSDEIDKDQFSFYEQICKKVAVDGVIFATSKPLWGRSTLQRIDGLKTWFTGEVVILTEKELYPDT
jgi:hypothetical protein